MKIKKTLSALAASVLMACSVSAATANAATTTASVNAANIIASVDTRISLLGSMPMKGDINSDKKITTEDTAVLEAYINGLVKITPYSRAYKILDVNWDGKLDKSDLALMPTKDKPVAITSPIGMMSFLHTGDYGIIKDYVVNSKDLDTLKANMKPITYTGWGAYDLWVARRIYDLNNDFTVDSKDYDLLKSYITLYPGLLVGTVL